MANEKRLIVDALKKYHDAQFTPGVYEHSIFGKAAMLLEVDAVEVVHGRWAKNWDGDNIVYCSQCYMPQDIPTPYCHSCGAKMDGERKDND